MIAADQPNCFDDGLLALMSSRVDGTMLDRARGTHHPDILDNRRVFCDQAGVAYDRVVYQRIVYDQQRRYDCLAEVDQGMTTAHTPEVVADGLVTKVRGVGLLLPVADCIATVVHDPVTGHLALLHLGRHSTVAGLMQRAIDWLVRAGSRSQDIVVWMSPSAQAETYVMQYFDHAADPDWQGFCHRSPEGIHLDIQGYNAAICQRAGIPAANIHRSPINTMTSPDYFSHARGDTSGRIAVMAMMR